ncbi:MAG: CDP-glycerol glycerophosphotransferase family protein [[Eubacterium] siraeum]
MKHTTFKYRQTFLVTDYSSVFFDYACTRKKVVLFPYDKDEYLCDRGMYMDMDDLPFPQVFDLDALVDELRSEKNYDAEEFVKTYCTWDTATLLHSFATEQYSV